VFVIYASGDFAENFRNEFVEIVKFQMENFILFQSVELVDLSGKILQFCSSVENHSDILTHVKIMQSLSFQNYHEPQTRWNDPAFANLKLNKSFLLKVEKSFHQKALRVLDHFTANKLNEI
jgi:hypothetical protein